MCLPLPSVIPLVHGGPSTQDVERLTICDTLEVVVGLHSVHLCADKLEIDFVLHVTHQNERCDNTGTLTGLHGRLDLAIPDVVCAHEQCANGAGCHGQKHTILILPRLARCDPVCLATIAQVSCVGPDTRRIQRVHAEVIALTCGRCKTRLEVEGVPGVAATKTVCADTTLSVLRATRRIVWALGSISALGNVGGNERGEGGHHGGRVAERVFHGGCKTRDRVGPRSRSCLERLWYARRKRECGDANRGVWYGECVDAAWAWTGVRDRLVRWVRM